MILQTGNNYELHIEGPSKETKGKIILGIRLKEGNFSEDANYVAVVLDKNRMMKVYEDLGDRLDEMK